MRSRVFFGVLLLCAARGALALTCGGFSAVSGDHVVVKYNAPIASGATYTLPVVSMSGQDIQVSRGISGGSATQEACVDASIDLGALGSGRFNLTWSDNSGFTSRRADFTFFVGSPYTGSRQFDLYSGVVPLPLPDQPIRLEMEACGTNLPVAYMSGTDVRVSLPRSGSPCSLYYNDLGVLPDGTYNVATAYAGFTDTFKFIVQHQPMTSSCDGTFSVYQTWAGSTHIHFEDKYQGYFPVFGVPMVTEILVNSDSGVDPVSSMTIVQPVTDVADSTRPGAATPSVICHGEDLDVGVLPTASYSLSRFDELTVDGGTGPLRFQEGSVFVWYDSQMQCTSPPRPSVPSPVEGMAFDVALNMVAFGNPVITKVTVGGNVVTVSAALSTPPSVPGISNRCAKFKATVPPLAAGEYTLVWRVGGLVYTTPFTVAKSLAKSTRQRAARH